MSIARDQEGEGKRRRRRWRRRMRKCLPAPLQGTAWLCAGSGQSGLQKETADELERRGKRSKSHSGQTENYRKIFNTTAAVAHVHIVVPLAAMRVSSRWSVRVNSVSSHKLTTPT